MEQFGGSFPSAEYWGFYWSAGGFYYQPDNCGLAMVVAIADAVYFYRFLDGGKASFFGFFLQQFHTRFRGWGSGSGKPIMQEFKVSILYLLVNLLA